MGVRVGFFYVVVYGSSGGSILGVFRWGFPMGLSVGLGLRYRLFRFGVFRWGFPMGLSVGLGLGNRLFPFGC